MTSHLQRVLVMTAVKAERDAVLRGFKNDIRFDVFEAGVGPIAAAVSTARVLMAGNYDLVIIAGIAGGFIAKAEVGSLVVASDIIAADLGVETTEGFSSLDQLGFGSTRVPVDVNLAKVVYAALLAKGLLVHMGPILTVSTVTGTANTAAEMLVRVPEAAAEAMEGYGIALAAQQWGIPVLELRAISNLVGPRDRTAWRIEEALKMLEAASSVLVEVL